MTKIFIADDHVLILEGLKKYKDEVEKGAFPAAEHTFTIKDEELKKLKKI